MAGKRETFGSVVSGLQGVGKTHLTETKVIWPYVKMHEQRTALIWDPKYEERWHNCDTLKFNCDEVLERQNDIDKGKSPKLTDSEKNIINMLSLAGRDPRRRVRVIMPFTPSGQEMSYMQKQATMVAIMTHYRRGMAFLEDVNNYIINFEATKIQSAFKALRHTSFEYIMHVQSLSPLRPIHYESITTIRMHKDQVSADKIANKIIDHYEIIKIGQLIVNEEYQKHVFFEEQSPDWYKYKSFFIVIKPILSKIIGANMDQFNKACTTYLNANKWVLKDMAYETAINNKRMTPNHADYMKARHDWIQQKLALGMLHGHGGIATQPQPTEIKTEN